MPKTKTERFTHFVGDEQTIDDSLREGTPVTSLCGKVWVLSRDPNAFALCPECVERIRRGWAA